MILLMTENKDVERNEHRMHELTEMRDVGMYVVALMSECTGKRRKELLLYSRLEAVSRRYEDAAKDRNTRDHSAWTIGIIIITIQEP